MSKILSVACRPLNQFLYKVRSKSYFFQFISSQNHLTPLDGLYLFTIFNMVIILLTTHVPLSIYNIFTTYCRVQNKINNNHTQFIYNSICRISSGFCSNILFFTGHSRHTMMLRSFHHTVTFILIFY